MPDLLRFAHMLTGNPHAAADLVQDALERALDAWPRIRNHDDPEGYVRRTMVNRNVSIWRRRRREYLVEGVPDRAHHDDPPMLDPELRAALAALPPRQRTVLVLRYGEDLSERQVAQMLGCSVGTVKSQTFKALTKLREHLSRPVAPTSAAGSPAARAAPHQPAPHQPAPHHQAEDQPARDQSAQDQPQDTSAQDQSAHEQPVSAPRPTPEDGAPSEPGGEEATPWTR
jgi:RNA polymerase sigma-70 factor (sigma-E family)